MWAQLSSALLGLWLMAAPAILGYGGPARTSDRIVGPLIVSFALIAAWEVTRPVRRVTLALGLWLLAAPVILGSTVGYGIVASANSLVVGLLVVLLSLVRGKVDPGRFGGGWSSLWARRSPDRPRGVEATAE